MLLISDLFLSPKGHDELRKCASNNVWFLKFGLTDHFSTVDSS